MGCTRLTYQKNTRLLKVVHSKTSFFLLAGEEKKTYRTKKCLNAFKYKYNGKELQDELGLNVYDYGARMYDPATARWYSVDAFAEKYYENSGYVYALNNPVIYIDPDGNQVEMCCGAVGRFLKGTAKGVWSGVKGTYNAVRHPVNTVSSLSSLTVGFLAQAVPGGPARLDNALGTNTQGSVNAVSQSIDNTYDAVVSGNAEQRGEVFGEILLAIAGTKGTSAILKGAKVAVNNPVPKTIARVIPADVKATTLGAPAASDVFVTAANDIKGLNATQIAEKLTIPQSNSGFNVIEFSTPKKGIASPVNRTNPGFVGKGKTAGGAREFTVPNQAIPVNATIKKID